MSLFVKFKQFIGIKNYFDIHISFSVIADIFLVMSIFSDINYCNLLSVDSLLEGNSSIKIYFIYLNR